MTTPHARRRLHVAGRTLAAVMVVAVGLPALRARPALADPPALTLAAQTPWVAPGTVFDLRVQLSPDPGPAGRLSVTVYSAVPNRTEFDRTVAGNTRDLGVLARPLAGQPLSAVPDDGRGVRDIPISTQAPTQPRDRSRLLLTRTGVYPVRVDYQPAGGGPEVSLVTHLLYLAGPIDGPKLTVTWIVPITATPSPGPDGSDVVPTDQADRLSKLVAALDASHLPVVLRPTPDTLAALTASSRAQDHATLVTLTRLATEVQVLTGPYVPLPVPALIQAGLGGDVTTQLTRGSDILASTLAVRPDGRTWAAQGPLDDGAAAFLRASQVDRLVVPDADLSPNPLPVTLSQPFSLSVRPDIELSAVAADAGLAGHFNGADPVLSAHQLLADLTSLWQDRPGQTRGVVVDTPAAWAPDPSFVQAFLDGLASSPVLSPGTLDGLFASVPAATGARGQRLTRTLVADPSIARDAAQIPVAQLRAERNRLEAFSSVLAPDNPLTARLDRVWLTAESSDLADLRARSGQLGLLHRLIDQQLALIQLPSGRKITLTSRTGQLPLTVLSGADYPLQVVVRVFSDKLSFPGSNAAGTATTELTLHKGNNPVQLTVRARTAGSFPLRITIVSPQGGLVVSATTFTVQSTALSGVGVVLSVGAALFLAVWWIRQITRNRRRRRQPPPSSPAPSGPPVRPAPLPLSARLTKVPDPAAGHPAPR